MTFCSTYIGDLDTPGFKLSMGGWGNLPRNIGPSIPRPQHYNAVFHDWTKARSIKVIGVDPDGEVAPVTPKQIHDYLDYVAAEYGDRISMRDDIRDSLEKARRFADFLDPERLYALAAECW